MEYNNIMFVKLTNGNVDQFPYTIGQFRRDNPNTSFPAQIPNTILRRYAVYEVTELAKPSYDPLVQTLVVGTPTREVIRMKTEADCTDPETGEVDTDQVGQPLYGNEWEVSYTAQNMEQATAESNVRARRDSLLQETDWMALSDVTMSSEMTTYRQALRDIPAQSGFPFSVTWPNKP
jgi:hypothetical protein